MGVTCGFQHNQRIGIGEGVFGHGIHENARIFLRHSSEPDWDEVLQSQLLAAGWAVRVLIWFGQHLSGFLALAGQPERLHLLITSRKNT